METKGKILSGDASRILGVSQVSIGNFVARGDLKAEQIGAVRVFDKNEVEQLAKKRKIKCRKS